MSPLAPSSQITEPKTAMPMKKRRGTVRYTNLETKLTNIKSGEKMYKSQKFGKSPMLYHRERSGSVQSPTVSSPKIVDQPKELGSG